jgi:hypothetical protein
MPGSRLSKLRARRLDPLVKIAGAHEVYERVVGEDDSVKYALGAMQPIDPAYNARTIEERTRVENQLSSGFQSARLDVDFDYQGSVTNDTNIRAYSDVDLLTVESRWVVIQPPNIPTIPYSGDPLENLREIRRKTIEVLRSAYPAATVDTSGGKCVNISGGSLQRKIDVIACAPWHTVEYVQTRQKDWLGIEILDNKKGERVPNKPFLHNRRIEQRDNKTNGGLRKLTRLLKSLRYDSDDKIELTSYDIAGIAYNNFDSWLTVQPGYDLLLVSNGRNYLRYLLTADEYRESLDMPNSTRKVFGAGGASKAGLEQLTKAMDALVAEIEQGLSRSLRKLDEARINY